jgi:hypothetical protein
MKRRGFLECIVTLVAGSAVAGKDQPKIEYDIINVTSIDKNRLIHIPPGSVIEQKAKSGFIASGWIDESGREFYGDNER